MSLHIPTLILTLLSGFLVLTLQIALVQKRLGPSPELRRWTWGSWALLVGVALLAGRTVLPAWLSVAVGNSLVCTGLALFGQALDQFVHRRPPSRALLWMQLPILAWFLFAAGLPQWQRTVVISPVCALLTGYCTYQALWSGRHLERALLAVGATAALSTVAFSTRAMHAVVEPQAYADFMQTSPGQVGMFLAAFIGLQGAGFGFVLALFERLAQQMQALASHDGLTGCFNRSTTDTLLGHELSRTRRIGQPLALAMLDLDHFKRINDEHGHAVGDQALKAFVHTVRQRLRASDVLGRVGGEEFAIVLPATDGPKALRVAEDIRRSVAAAPLPLGSGKGSLPIAVSIGVAVALPADAVPADVLYQQADQALYRAKQAGRNRVHLYGSTAPVQTPG